MNENQTGGPAFPTINAHQNGPNTYHYEGMTLRDYFAAKAMQGMFAADTSDSTIAIPFKASIAYEMADAMLRARGMS